MNTSVSNYINTFFSRLKPLPRRVHNLGGSAVAFFLSLQNDPFVFIANDEEAAEIIHKDIRFYRKFISGMGAVYIPPSDSEETSGLRALSVYDTALLDKRSSIVASQKAVQAGLWSPMDLIDLSITLRKSDEIERSVLTEKLINLGYRQVSLVTEHGEFSARQWLIDIFPSSSEYPVRVEFFGDVIEGLRTFDIDGQRSLDEIDSCLLLPAREPEAGRQITEIFPGYKLFQMEGKDIEYPEGSTILSKYAISGEGVDGLTHSFKGLGILPEERRDISDLAFSVAGLSKGYRTVLIAPSEGQAKRLKEIFSAGGLIAPIIPASEILDYEGRLSISVGELSSGLFIDGIIFLTEGELFRRPPYRPIRKTHTAKLLSTLDDISNGDYVVHKEKGIGLYLGLTRQTIEGEDYDLMILEYQGGDRLYLPLEAIDKINKFHGSEDSEPSLDRLGVKSNWLKTKERVKEKLREMTDKLLNLYAERETAKGTAFSEDTELHAEFDGFFQYDETPDQITAIEQILLDMRSDRPMDRLLCGDVGYGKTEVAMRAAFRAVYDGFQVAVIVPTTLLCEQHMRTFKNRFSAFPFKIESLSRFKSAKEQKEIIKSLKEGSVDIIIGTHSLLRKDVEFSNLGLLVIDEEHRFGVAQKERLKELKKALDVLSMTATPIPRTLQMSLAGIRGMSTIATPPEERLAVKSEVAIFDDKIIREAIQREVLRGGQVFFVHNRISDIIDIRDKILKLMPELKMDIAHGQMTERELERVMLAFMNGETEVLVCTAIVGSGIDIPNANTIIIDLADRMGLADLYQLKGRVGRSSRRAYAYFLIPGWNDIAEDAKKRLQALAEMSYLGAGLRLAMRDLEIRGAGNLLGHQQSGNIDAVGFELYTELLEEAVGELKGQPLPEKTDIKIDIGLKAHIPDEYVPDMTLRLTIYRKLAGIKTADDLKTIEAEMRDRFGPVPEKFMNLLRMMQLKLMSQGGGISEIKRYGDKLRFTFTKTANVSADAIMKAVRGNLKFYEDGFELKFKGDAFKEAVRVMEAIR